MSDKDYAILVGITAYPELHPPLNGPLNDVAAMDAWLRSPTGGNIPQDDTDPNDVHIQVIIASKFPKFTRLRDARPAQNDIWDAIIRLDDIAAENEAKLLGRKVGRRLYLYFAGHGFMLGNDRTGYLSANASLRRSSFHIVVQECLNWFKQAAYFEEVVVIADCCNQRMRSSVIPSPFPLDPINGAADEVARVKTLLAVAAGPSLPTFETEFTEYGGAVRGVFTVKLLECLTKRGDKDGKVTSAWLRDIVRRQMISHYEAIEDPLADLRDPIIVPDGEIELAVGVPPSPVTCIIETAVSPRRLRFSRDKGGGQGFDSPITKTVKAGNNRAKVDLLVGLHLIEEFVNDDWRNMGIVDIDGERVIHV